jgi:hypothetical protein
MMFWGISGLLEAFSLFTIDMKWNKTGQNHNTLDEFMQAIYQGFPDYKKAVVNLLSFSHGSGNTMGSLACYRNSGKDDLKSIIDKGEDYNVEFKSTLRWDLKAGKTNQQVERASLKTISAFLNSGRAGDHCPCRK